MKVACLILLAGLACAAGAENRRLLQDGFNPLDSLLNKNNTFEKIGKEATARETFFQPDKPASLPRCFSGLFGHVGKV